MYVILSCDVGSRRVGKVLKVCRKCLRRRHRSVLEGELTEAEPRRLERELEGVVDPSRDAVCAYRVQGVRYASKDELGTVPDEGNVF
ncbi:MAG: CRISPR-associated endonuclease Cas2 [Atopobiaceae bacterium]|nr:CRISPR-associated endonuclease Cas2 [Atopobiaceae bacterium]